MSDCLFCKIVRKEIPAAIVAETPDALAFLDIKPVHPGHVLVIPKHHSDDLADIDLVDLQAVMDLAQQVMRALLHEGYDGVNLVNNCKPAGHQVVFHTHVHVIPRVAGDGLKTWPQHEYAPGEKNVWQQKIAGRLLGK